MTKYNKNDLFGVCLLGMFICFIFGIIFGVYFFHGDNNNYITYKNENYIQDINSSNYIDFIKNENCACIEKGWDGVSYYGEKHHCYKNEK